MTEPLSFNFEIECRENEGSWWARHLNGDDTPATAWIGPFKTREAAEAKMHDVAVEAIQNLVKSTLGLE